MQKLLGLLVVIPVLMAGSGADAWKWQANNYGKQLAAQNAAHHADLTSIANAGAAQARQALAKQQQVEQALAELDTKLTKEKTNALDENDRLRRAVADGDRRLRIAGICRAGGSGPTGAASLGDAGAVELAPAAGRAVLGIQAGIIADQAALRVLQGYVKNVCLR